MVHRLEAAVRRNGMEHLTRRCYSLQQKGSLDEPSQQGTDSHDRRDPQVPAAYADHPRLNPDRHPKLLKAAHRVAST
jgi:hypothetical protein